MLVVSRRQNDKIVFPHLGITVEVLRIAGSSVRMGVQAPPSVTVLRHELASDEDAGETGRFDPLRQLRHNLRNELNAVALHLHLLQKQWETGMGEDAEKTLEGALERLRDLDHRVGELTRVPPPGPTAPAGLRRALLIEDDPNESELLAGYLRLSGFEVDTAGDGCAALDYLSGDRRPDIVLLDMLMPHCNGPATISAIRSNPKLEGLKVFAVSGLEPGELGVSIGPHGVDYWFAKPVNPQRLVAEINRRLTESPAVPAQHGG